MSKYNEACSEVSVILNHLDEEEYSKIPSEVIEAIEKNKNKDHVFEFDEEVELRKQKLLKETRAILFNIFRDYLCTQSQRETIIQMQKEERHKIEERKKLQYSVDNLFKKKKNNNIQDNKETVTTQNTALVKEEKGNCIFIGGKTFVVSYQENDFFSNDSHNLALYLRNCDKSKLKHFYIATCLFKSLSHKYSWGNSISKTKIKNDKISLPIKDGKPNYDVMELLISAVQKLVIKDVVKYSDAKISATKQVIQEKGEF